MDLIRAHQLNIMMFMSGMCGILAFITLFAKTLSSRRKSILALMETAVMLLLMFDRASYIYRGAAGELAYYMVRLSNGMVFFLSLLVPYLVTRFLDDLLRQSKALAAIPKRLRLCDFLFVTGTILVVVSRFTGLFYTIDESNIYRRSPGFLFSYLIPLLIVLLQESVLFQYRNVLKKHYAPVLMVSLALPSAVAVVQVFAYGLSLTNLMMVLVAIVFFLYTLKELGEEVEQARSRELEFYKEMQQKEAVMFGETTEALANAIDAKDTYTRGHSARVALLSRLIAGEAGFSETDCDQIYYAALLHDVGKIGVPDGILSKVGALTDQEFEKMKQHTVLGNQILSSIRHFPELSIGAHYHHERFDGRGYPDGLSGGEIPEMARIIAVADAYDAMTSRRSYRDPLDLDKVRRELGGGRGTQFDPVYAEIMLRLMDSELVKEIERTNVR